MTVDCDTRRVLLAAAARQAAVLHSLFTHPELQHWAPCDADSPARAHFLLQHEPFDALLADESLWQDDEHGLSWVLPQTETPLVVLLTPGADVLSAVLEGGAEAWLPRDLALEHPPLLAAALDQAARRCDVVRRHQQTGADLNDCQRRVRRLLGMLWDNTPVDGRTRWYSQRHMMERLQEELARLARHGGHFSIVLGEVRPRTGAAVSEALLPAWISDHVHRLKRRCDLLGHYGPHGFLLLLPHTSEAGAAVFCQRLRYALEQVPPRPPLPATLVFGLASCTDGRMAPKVILRRAEERLEEARAAAAVGLVS